MRMRRMRGTALVRAVTSTSITSHFLRRLPITSRLTRILPVTSIPNQCTLIRYISETPAPVEAKPPSNTEPSVPQYVWPGDWICGNCQAHNFRHRKLCFECQSTIGAGRVFYKPGMWHCPTCDIAVTSFTPVLPFSQNLTRRV